jgi:chromosome partitioning protein
MICVVLNRKGGVGKTSTCFHVAGALAKRGQRILLIDTDPQANLTEGLLGAQVAEGSDPSCTVAALFGDAFVPNPLGLILPTPIPGVSILPGSDKMESFNLPDPSGHPSQTAIRDFLMEVRDAFDICLIDCPPNLQLCSWSAMAAADGLVIPVQAEDFGGQGLKKINRAVGMVRSQVNPNLRLYGYLITMFNKSLGIHAAYAEKLRSVYGESVFEAVMPQATDFKVAVTSGTPISHLKPKSAAAKAMAAVADELLVRSGQLREVA